MDLGNILNSFNIFRDRPPLILEKYLDEIEPTVDINLQVEKMDHNNALDIVLPRLAEFEYETKGVKYKVNTTFKISELKIDSEDDCRYIKLNTIYKLRFYCDIIKDLTIRNSITHQNINYEIIHRNKNKEIRNRINSIKNIPIFHFTAGEEIFIKLKDILKPNQSINIKFYGIVLKNEERKKVMYLDFQNKDGYVFNR
jgi:hypothetical protein